MLQSTLYKHVIDDVVRNMKEEYLNESMDVELLEELRTVCGACRQLRVCGLWVGLLRLFVCLTSCG